MLGRLWPATSAVPGQLTDVANRKPQTYTDGSTDVVVLAPKGAKVPSPPWGYDAATQMAVAYVPPLALAQAQAAAALTATANAAVAAQLWMVGDPNFNTFATSVQSALQTALQQIQAAGDVTTVGGITAALPAVPTPANQPPIVAQPPVSPAQPAPAV